MSASALYLGREWNVDHDHDQRVTVNNAELRYATVGTGEPILCIHGTTMVDAIITPLRFYPPLFDEYQITSYYRAGYSGSTSHTGSVSIEEGAEHAKQLLDHLGIEKVHLMAFSFGGVVGWQFLLSYPERVHSAILLEAYLPREAPAGVQANTDAYLRARVLYEAGDKLGAAQSYMASVCGPSLLSACDMTGPLDVWKRVENDIDTVFNIDFPAIMAWKFKMSEAERVVAQKPTMPVLAVMGLDSESAMPGFRETQEFLMRWLPQAERCGIPNATHGLQIMNPVAVGEAVYTFLKKHPMT